MAPSQETDERDLYPVLYSVARAINSSLDQKEVLQLIAQSVTEAFGVKGCAIRLLNPGRDRLDLVASHGLSEEFLSKGIVRPDLSAAQTLCSDGKPVVLHIDDTEHWQYPEETKQEGIATSLTVPLQLDGEPMGILRLYAAERRTFSPRDMEFVSVLAELSALALKNARVFEEVKQSQEMLTEYAFGPYTR
jgi:transcriptional regulator with GAF, ATPase, and Fis domain